MLNQCSLRFTIFSFILLSVLGGVFNSCQNTGKADNNLKIVTTTGMIRDAVENIVKDSAEVKSLMGPGVDPHLYKATQGDLKQLRQADMVFYNGLHLEGKMTDILEKFGKEKPVIPMAKGVPKKELIETKAFSGTYDPHIWFDITLWQEAVGLTANKIQSFDSNSRSYYQRNHQDFQKELSELHQWVAKEIKTIPVDQRTLITAHDAFGYFGKAYDIQVKGLQGISTTSEYGLKDIKNLVDYIVKKKIKAIFIESSVPRKNLEAVIQGCLEKDHKVKIGGKLYSDAMGQPGTPEGSYTGMVRHNVNTIVNNLK